MGENPLEPTGLVQQTEKDYDNEQFDSLEERIFGVSGKDYEYCYLRVRIDQFLYNALKVISQATGANKPTVIARTAEHGLCVLRDRGILDKAGGVVEIVSALERLIADDIENRKIANAVSRSIESHSINMGGVSKERMTDAIDTKMKDSMYAESVDKYTDSIFSSKAMIMRTLLSAGITDSEQRMRLNKSMAEEQMESFIEQVEEAQERVEMELFRYLSIKMAVWSDREVDAYEREQLGIILDNVQTDYGNRIIEMVENSNINYP